LSAGHVVVVGGGISGLVTAWELSRAPGPVAVTVVESTAEWGGKIATSRVGGLVVEAGADSFLSSKPWALELCGELGLTGRLVDPLPDGRTFVFSRGRLRPLPEGLLAGAPRPVPLVRSGLLSPPGLARLALEAAVPSRRDGGDESLAAFFRRRMGREACERLMEPLLAGIHAGDAEHLSLAATFPAFAEMERRSGSLVRAALKGRAATPSRSPFVSLAGGMGELVDALVAEVRVAGVDLRAGQPVTAVRAGSGTFEVAAGTDPALPADAVVLATPAPVTADLLRSLCPPAAGLAGAIPHASTATVSLAFAAHGPRIGGYGFVVPRVERRDLIAATFSSTKWPGRAPSGSVLVRGYLGGAGREVVLERDDTDLAGLVRRELAELAGVDGEPLHAEVHRFPRAVPQYNLGHLERVAGIEAAVEACPGLFVTGASYRGVGIPDCVHHARATATTVLDHLAGE
jgi:oxygen-dependent protoporphyrinogen oxidase